MVQWRKDINQSQAPGQAPGQAQGQAQLLPGIDATLQGAIAADPPIASVLTSSDKRNEMMDFINEIVQDYHSGGHNNGNVQSTFFS